MLNNKNVDLVSLDSWDRVDTTSPMGKAFFQIAGVFAALERSMINARTKAGIERAKLGGVKFGRTVGSINKTTAGKIEKMRLILEKRDISKLIVKNKVEVRALIREKNFNKSDDKKAKLEEQIAIVKEQSAQYNEQLEEIAGRISNRFSLIQENTIS